MQFRNATTVLGAINLLNTIGVNIPTEAVREGFEHVVELTGLMGRWQVLQENPKVVCDTGLRKILQHKQSSTVYRAQSAIPCRKPWKKHWREPDKTTSSLSAEALSSWRTPYPCS